MIIMLSEAEASLIAGGQLEMILEKIFGTSFRSLRALSDFLEDYFAMTLSYNAKQYMSISNHKKEALHCRSSCINSFLMRVKAAKTFNKLTAVREQLSLWAEFF